MAAAAWAEPNVDMDKLCYEIFSILETKFLFGYDDAKLVSLAGTSPETPIKLGCGGGKVRILSIDGSGAGDGLLAAAALARLESSLRRRTGDPSAGIADFFDLAAGSGSGGVLAALLFSRGHDGRALFSAQEALRFLAENQKRISDPSRRGIFRRSSDIFRRVFGGSTVREVAKPLLVPCYDLGSDAGFTFSRVDAMEMDGFDFAMEDVCAATCVRDRAVRVKSVDGRREIVAVGGVAAGLGNPTAAAITHVLNNNKEFPRANGVEDLLVLSLAGGVGGSPTSKAEIARVACDGAADMVDQAVRTAFRRNRTTNYVRIQANGSRPGKTRAGRLAAADAVLEERYTESILFRGSKLSEQTNAEKLETFAGELISEHERGGRSNVPTVVI